MPVNQLCSSLPPPLAVPSPFQDLLKQTGHYSEKARKHALQGLADLFTRHPAELRQHTHMFFTKVRAGEGVVKRSREHVIGLREPAKEGWQSFQLRQHTHLVFTKVRFGEGEVKRIKNITADWVGGRGKRGEVIG